MSPKDVAPPAKEEDNITPGRIVHPDGRKATSAPVVPAEIVKQAGLLDKPDGAGMGPAKPVKDDALSVSAIDNPDTEAAVDDIIAKESDELLAVQDHQRELLAPEIAKKGFGAKVRHFLRAWWRNKPARWITISILCAAIGVLAFVPKTRYLVLNTVGVRSRASVIVLDDATKLPLKHVTVRLGAKTAQTNKEGRATFSGLKLGHYKLAVSRVAFASYDKDVTIGWGSNPLGSYMLQPVGTRYILQINNYISGKPIAGAEADAEMFNALSDASGKITLTVGDIDIAKLELKVSADGYRSEAVSIEAANTVSKTITLVPSHKAVFISKQSGTYDVFSADVDGANRKLLLAGTGSETNNISLVVSPDNSQAALVSTRDAKRNSEGYLLYALTFINIEQGTSMTVDHAEQIQLVDWVGKRLVYRSTVSGASAVNANRNKLVSYDYNTNTRIQLATANQFNMTLSARGSIYYAVSSNDASAALGLFRIKPDGTSREQLTNQEVWTGLRGDYGILSLQTPDGWYEYTMDSKRLAKIGAPPDFNTFLFMDNSRDQRTAWVDLRDGKGALIVKDLINDDTAKVLVSQAGIAYPVRWLDDATIIYRVVSPSESAEYVVSVLGGQPKKVTDITAVYGYTQVY